MGGGGRCAARIDRTEGKSGIAATRGTEQFFLLLGQTTQRAYCRYENSLVVYALRSGWSCGRHELCISLSPENKKIVQNSVGGLGENYIEAKMVNKQRETENIKKTQKCGAGELST